MWKYVEDPTITPVKAVREGNVKERCATYKKLVSKYKKSERPLTCKEDKPITGGQQHRKKLVENFSVLLNRPKPLSAPDIETMHTDYPTNVTTQTVEEISKVTRWIMSGKQQEQATYKLKHWIQVWIRQEEQVQTEWKEGYLIRIPKKYHPKCENYTEITLLPLPCQMFNSTAELNRA